MVLARPVSALRPTALALAAGLALGACEGPGNNRRADSERRNLELFNELIGRCTMQPAEGFDEGSYFDRIAQAYADAPRPERAALERPAEPVVPESSEVEVGPPAGSMPDPAMPEAAGPAAPSA